MYETIAVYRKDGVITYGFLNRTDWKHVDLSKVDEYRTYRFNINRFQEVEETAKKEVPKLKLIPLSLENIFDPNGVEEDL